MTKRIRGKQPRGKFLICSVSPKEKELARVIASSMSLNLSDMIRRLLNDQYIRLAKGEYSIENSLNLKEVEE